MCHLHYVLCTVKLLKITLHSSAQIDLCLIDLVKLTLSTRLHFITCILALKQRQQDSQSVPLNSRDKRFMHVLTTLCSVHREAYKAHFAQLCIDRRLAVLSQKPQNYSERTSWLNRRQRPHCPVRGRKSCLRLEQSRSVASVGPKLFKNHQKDSGHTKQKNTCNVFLLNVKAFF